jgi:2-polyprenyl-6-methoxyphenol hydroxylase-like FAD-dependent oxidoreductase
MKAEHPTTTVPVLIAGAGPAGLTVAITLARYGVESLIVDRKQTLSSIPRASLVSTGSMELFRSWGLERELAEAAIDVRFTGFIGETLASKQEEFPLGVPSRDQAAVVSPAAPLCVTQDVLEPILLRHLEGLGVGTVELGTELVSFEERDGAVRALLRGPGGERIVEASHLIGADGVRSRVREELEIGQSGPGEVRDAVSTLIEAPLDGVLGSGARHAIYAITHAGAPDGVFVTVSSGDRWVYGFTGEPGSIGPAELAPEAMERRIRLSVGAPMSGLRIERIGRFAYSALLADRFREGRVFLAGDAAHRVTPRGGTGMNTAIRDGRDIGWKLAWTLHGWAGDELLDTYERERRPVAGHNMERSVDPEGSMRSAAEELHVDLGPRIPHVWAAPGRSTLDLLGAGYTLLRGPDSDWRPPEPSAPVTEHRLDAITARAVGLGARGALLARPDGVAAEVAVDWPARAAGAYEISST